MVIWTEAGKFSFQVLRDAMKTVDELDSNLISRIRSKFQEEITAYQNDPLASSVSFSILHLPFGNFTNREQLICIFQVTLNCTWDELFCQLLRSGQVKTTP